MATYTSNYNLEKPDVTDPFGDFRAGYNSNMDIIDQNLGGGGGGGGHTIIDPNGSDMAQRAGLQFTGSCSVSDDAVNDKTVVNISGGGGGSFFGCAIDENNKLFEGTINNFNQSLSYTATEDGIALCWYKGSSGTWQFLAVNNVFIRLGGNGTDQPVSYSIPIRKGDTVSACYQSGSESCYFWLSVYGIKQGTSGIFAPVIYSDTERKIGIWRDNKPLYQKTIDLGSDTNISNANWETSVFSISNLEKIILIYGVNSSGTYYPLNAYHSGDDVNLLACRDGNPANIRWVTLQYTKTTDTAGSGDWNTDGVPTEHYSTSERVVGTWITGKPLYEKTFNISSSIPQNTTYVVGDITNFDLVEVHGIALLGTGAGFNMPYYNSANEQCQIWWSSNELKIYQKGYTVTGAVVTIRYTKTTD